MKNPLTALLPALALFALGGCAGTSALSSSEDDGVYYSSRDRTTAVVNNPAPATPASTNEAANPDYNDNANSSSARRGSGSDQYYDNTYTYVRGAPNYGVASYAPYSPYTSISYGYSSYGWGGGACGYSPYSYGICDPFYSPFYSPYYGYGSGISISFGFGRPYGGYGYGRPYGYGYGGGFYDPYYYSSPFYGGYYGRGSYYGNNYYGSNSYYGGNRGYSNGGNYSNDRNGRRTTGHLSDGMSDGRYSTGGVNTANPTPGAPAGGRPRGTADGLIAPGTGTSTLPGAGATNERSRGEAVTAAPATQPTRTNESFNRPRRLESTEQPRYRDMEQPATGRQPMDANSGQDQMNRDNSRGRMRNTENPAQGGQQQPQVTEQPVRQEGQRRRGGFFQDVFTQPANNGGGQADQQRQRSYEQPQRSYEQPQRSYEQPQQQRQQRSYEQPQQQQRSYEQPQQQQQRSYEQPQQRSYEQPQRSYSQPSNGGGGGGGGGHSRGRGE